MKPSNGFNKKQKEEIREIVKSEIREALRKNAKPEVNVKDEVVEAIYSVLNEKNDNLIKNLSEIEDKISKEETEKSWFAGFIKFLLRILCYILWLAFGVIIIFLLYICIRYHYDDGDYVDYRVAIEAYLFIVGLIILHFHNSINEMRKNDLYNSFMFIITMISFIITVWAVVN